MWWYSIWKLKALYFPRQSIWILSHSYFRSLPLLSPNPGHKSLVLVWCLKLNRILLMPLSKQIYNPLKNLSEMLALISLSLLLVLVLIMKMKMSRQNSVFFVKTEVLILFWFSTEFSFLTKISHLRNENTCFLPTLLFKNKDKMITFLKSQFSSLIL